MLFGDSSHFSSSRADSCLPNVSTRGHGSSHDPSPKLSPLFHSEDHAQRALELQLSGFGDKSAFCPKPCGICTSTKRARKSRRICTSIFIGLKTAQNQHLRKNLAGEGNTLGSPAQRGRSSFVAPACPDLSRGSFEGSPRAFRSAVVFLGAPLFCALCNKWVFGLQFSCDSIAPQGQQNEHLRKNGRGVPPVQEIRITRQIQLESGCFPRRNRWERQNVV
jgi:hypothetical protein